MNAPFALGLVLLASIVCGIALWPRPAAAAAAPAPGAAAPAARPPALAAGHELDLAFAAWAMLAADERAVARIAAVADAACMVGRAVPISAVVAGRGVALAGLAPAPRLVLERLLRDAAATLRATATAASAPWREQDAAGVHFACAGGDGRTQPAYARLHGETFVVEWLGLADGSVHAAWRDFAADAAGPWLVERVFPTRR